ncbi:MAG TPA: 50S ribosomal protein L10 [Gemmatimonadales bacterium]|jgi:large subunit ribosomal protein L10|nr:50S ribosomal protein L10 [Gemmatimonadales bacterium]
MSKTERQETVDTLSKRFKASPNLYVTDFTGLNVLRMTELRRRLRTAGVSYVVVKNSLAQRALEANNIKSLNDHLAGPTGLVLAGKDPVAAAKVLTDFAREFEKPAIRIGLVDGRSMSPAQVKQLASLPSRDVLLSQLLGAMQSPLAQLAGVMNGMLMQVVGAFEALHSQRSAGADS